MVQVWMQSRRKPARRVSPGLCRTERGTEPERQAGQGEASQLAPRELAVNVRGPGRNRQQGNASMQVLEITVVICFGFSEPPLWLLTQVHEHTRMHTHTYFLQLGSFPSEPWLRLPRHVT